MLYLKAVVHGLDDQNHVLGDELLRCKLVFSDKAASTFDLTVWDPDKTVSGWLTEGCQATFYVDDEDIVDLDLVDPKLVLAKRLVGKIQTVEVVKPSKNERKLNVEGIDTFFNTLLQRIVVESYQNKEVSLIVKDLLEKYAPDFDRTTYVNATSTTLEDVRFNYRTLKECLDTLAEASAFTYYCDPDLKVHWVAKGSEDSGIIYSSSDVAPVPSKAETIKRTKNRVYVVGGNRQVEDQKSEGDSAYVSLNDYWYAQSFTPTWDYLSQISLKLQKVGSPEILFGTIRKDENGPGEIVARFTYDPDYLSTSASWKPIRIEKDLVKGEKYWIVLEMLGDASNTVRWYHDGGSSGEHAYSSDGSTWTVQSNSYVLTHKTYYELTVVAHAFDSGSKDSYDWRETVFRDESIMDYNVAKKIAKAKLDELKDAETVLSTIHVLDPTEIPQPSKTATVNVSDFDVNEKFVIREVSLDFKGGQKSLAKMQLALGSSAEELGEVLAATRLYLDKVAMGKFGTESGLLTILAAVSSTLSLADVLSANVKNAWTIESSQFNGDDRLG